MLPCDSKEKRWKDIWRELSQRNLANAYLYDFDQMKETYGMLQKALGPLFQILFSIKSNPSPKLLEFLAEETSAGADVSSEKELRLALGAGFKRENIFFVGPGKSDEELAEAVNQQIGCIVTESLQEVMRLNRLGGKSCKKAPIALRVNPDYSIKGIKMAMGGRATQFGINQQEVGHCIQRILREFKNIDFRGLHAYVGTRILNAEDAVWNITQILDLAKEFYQSGIPIRVVDVGGGLGIPYYELENHINLLDFQHLLENYLKDYPDVMKKEVRFFLESGRFLAGTSGYFLAHVEKCWHKEGEQNIEITAKPCLHTVSEGGIFSRRKLFITAALKKFGFEIGEIKTNIWYRLHGFKEKWSTVTSLPLMQSGDYILFKNSGAYGPTASRIWECLDGHPPEFAIQGNCFVQIRQADTWQDLIYGATLYQ